jgi:hypothetical protein
MVPARFPNFGLLMTDGALQRYVSVLEYRYLSYGVFMGFGISFAEAGGRRASEDVKSMEGHYNGGRRRNERRGNNQYC